jgi:hypothetical protein
MTEQLTHEHFAQNLHARFKVHPTPENVVDLELIEVSEFKKSPVQERFWIVFSGPSNNVLEQGTYVFENENLGRIEIFMTPINQDAESRYYEAVFNRLVTPDGGK